MIIEIIYFLRTFGLTASREQVINIYDYLHKMMQSGRLITFRNNDKLIGFCTYSMCDQFEPLYEKKIWEYSDHDEDGKAAYIEMIVCEKWNKKLREMVEKTIASKYPNYEYGVWHRPTQDDDKIVIAKRRDYVSSKHSNQ